MNKKITMTEEDLVTMIKSIIQERKEVKEQSDKKKIKTILKQKACAKLYAKTSVKLTDEGWRTLGEGEKRPSRWSKKLDRKRIRDAKCNKEWWVRPKGQSDKQKEKSEKKYRIAGIALTNDFIQAVTTAAVSDAKHPVVDSAIFDSAAGGTIDALKEIFDNMLALQSLIKGLISWVKSDPKVCENRKINAIEVLKLHAVPNVEQVLGNIEALGREIEQPPLRMITKKFVKSAEDVLSAINADPDSAKEINDAGYRNVQQLWIKEAKTRGEEFKKHMVNVEAWFKTVGCQVAEGKASKIKRDKYINY